MSEHKQRLTVLQVDVSDSVRLYEQLGDERAFGEVRACLDLCGQAVAARGGRVARAVGDGLICVFADAPAAVDAALDMQAALRERMAGRERALEIRVGLHTGAVLGEGEELFGEPFRVAARMTRIAAGSQIIASGDTVAALPTDMRSLTRYLDAITDATAGGDVAAHEVLWQDAGDYTQLPGRFEAVLAKAGVGRMWLTHGGREFAVVTSVTLGRHAGNDVVLADPLASRNHARIERRREKFVLIDQSSNGTFVAVENGDRLRLLREEMILSGRGVITFGHAASDAGGEAVGFRIA